MPPLEARSEETEMTQLNITPLLAVCVALVALGVADVASAAKSREARVAGGQKVTLTKSRFSSNELKARRPDMQRLIPKVR
jgi:hypothetical protein